MRRATWVLLVASVAVAWVGVVLLAVVPHPHEGRVLFTFTETHGVHSSDVVAALAAALWSFAVLGGWRSTGRLRSGS